MRMAILLVALLVGACAHKPELAGTETKAPIVAKVAKPAAKPADPVPEAKPTTFKHRWYDRFLKHKSK